MSNIQCFNEQLKIVFLNVISAINIYTLYIHYIYSPKSTHKLPIKLKRHAALRLIQRFDMSIEELRHIIKTGKQIKPIKKEGDIGIIERKLGKSKIRIKFTIKDDTIWIITVEGGI